MRFYVYPKLQHFENVKQLKKFIQQMSLRKDIKFIIAVEVKGKIAKMCITRNPRVILQFCDNVIMLSSRKNSDKTTKTSHSYD